MVRVEGELLKLLEVAGFLQKGGAAQEGNFLEVLNKLMSQLLIGNNLSQENPSQEATPTPTKNSQGRTLDRNFNVERLLAFLSSQNIQFLGDKVVISEKIQASPDVNLVKDFLNREFPTMSKSKIKSLFKFPQDLEIKNLAVFPQYEEFKKHFKKVLKPVIEPFKNHKITLHNEENLKDSSLISEAKKAYELGIPVQDKADILESKIHKKVANLIETDFPIKLKDAEGVLNTSKLKLNKEFNPEVVRELTRAVEGGKENPKEKRLGSELSQRAYDIQISSLQNKVKEPERAEGVLPVIREAVFREEGKLKRASVKLDNLNLEVKLVRDKVNLQFLLPQGKENMLGFFDYLKISQILNSMGLRVESFTVNGQELNRQRIKDREKDNINLNEPTQKDRDYLNASSSFSVAL